ncbi:glutathione-dependent disulfide-bond oxidoreductase, partial [Acinetobacter baumannii]
AGDDYTIADIANFTWFGNMVREAYGAQEFLSVHEYTHVQRWVKLLEARPGVQRGRMVNRGTGPLEGQLRERHDASDFANNTQDKVEARGGTRV